MSMILLCCLGAAIIRSSEPLRVDEWITLVAERNQQDGSLSINGGVAVKGAYHENNQRIIYWTLINLGCPGTYNNQQIPVYPDSFKTVITPY